MSILHFHLLWHLSQIILYGGISMKKFNNQELISNYPIVHASIQSWIVTSRFYVSNRECIQLKLKGKNPFQRHNAKRHNTKRHNAKRDNAKRYNAKRHNAKRHNANRHNAKRHNAKRHKAKRHSANRYNAKGITQIGITRNNQWP